MNFPRFGEVIQNVRHGGAGIGKSSWVSLGYKLLYIPQQNSHKLMVPRGYSTHCFSSKQAVEIGSRAANSCPLKSGELLSAEERNLYSGLIPTPD